MNRNNGRPDLFDIIQWAILAAIVIAAVTAPLWLRQ